MHHATLDEMIKCHMNRQCTRFKKRCEVKPVYYGHLGTDQMILQVSLHAKRCFGTITKSPDYAGVLIFKCPDL